MTASSTNPSSAFWANPARWLRVPARVSLALMFAYAGALKLADPTGFATDIANYRMLPDALVGPLALGLPVLEVVTALGLLWPAYAQGAAALCALMLGAFAIAMAQTKLRGIDLACGCFGAGADAQVSWSKVALDVALAMLALWLVRPVRDMPATPPLAAADA